MPLCDEISTAIFVFLSTWLYNYYYYYQFIQMEGAAQKVLGLYKVSPQHKLQ